VYSEKGELEHIKMGCGKDDQGRCEWFKLAGRLDSEGCVLCWSLELCKSSALQILLPLQKNKKQRKPPTNKRISVIEHLPSHFIDT